MDEIHGNQKYHIKPHGGDWIPAVGETHGQQKYHMEPRRGDQTIAVGDNPR